MTRPLLVPPGSREFRGLGGRLPLAYAVGNRGPLPSDDSDLAATAMMNGGCMGCHGGCAVLFFSKVEESTGSVLFTNDDVFNQS